jgi:hypothetical protein
MAFTECRGPTGEPFASDRACWHDGFVGSADTADMEDMLMSVPDPWRTIWRATDRATRKAPFRLVSMMVCQSSSGMSTTFFLILVPALLKRMSIRPKAATVAWIAASASRRQVSAVDERFASANTAAAVSSSGLRVS